MVKAHSGSEFVGNFEKEFEHASLADRRALIGQCVSQIEIDPEAGKATVYVRNLPAVNDELRQFYAQAEEGAKGRGKLFSNVEVPGTGLEPA
jgi:hypothetical protein